jgi:O-antigen ligase
MPSREKLAALADCLAVGVAISIPWSTSATGILIAAWLVAILPSLRADAIRREVAAAAGGLPVLLAALAAAGMLWADVAWQERFGGFESFLKLLTIPVLLAQFRRSQQGMRVLVGFFLSALVVLILSWSLVLIPSLPWSVPEFRGVPVKDYILQSGEFLLCALALLGWAFEADRLRAWHRLAAVALALLFLANIAFVATSRTTLLVAPALILLLGWRCLGWKGLVASFLVGSIVAVSVAFTSPYLRGRLASSMSEFQAYLAGEAPDPNSTSTAVHLEYLRKSLAIVETAPILGHGTGSILDEFRKAAVGESGVAAFVSVNPHDQIFAVAIQLGLVGGVILLALWSAHAWLFRGGGMAAWSGLLVVVQNVVSSLFNSHLFDYTQGWLYVFGVGVAGGMVLRQHDSARAGPAPSDSGSSAQSD